MMTPLAVASWSMITPLGEGDATIDALFEGRSGFSLQPSSWPLRNALAAVLPGHTTDPARPGERQRLLAERICRRLLNSISIDARELRDRCAFVFATSYGHLLDDADGESMSAWATDCVRSVGCRQVPVVAGSGCSSGSDGIGVAAAMLQCGIVDIALVVAVDIVTAAKRLAHSTLGTMTAHRHKPFDVSRSGMLLGEAAAGVVLQRAMDCPEPAGELLGVGAANDAFGLTAPDPSGLSVRLALDRALRAADLQPRDLALYLAHGTATALNDALEATVVAETFADNPALTIVGTKGALGHSLGACGVVEFILLLQMLQRRRAPPTCGLTTPIDAIAPRFAAPGGRPLSGSCGVSVTLGFGGFNTALIARA